MPSPRGKRYVIPGDVVAEGSVAPGPNTHKVDKRVLSTKVGIAEVAERRAQVVAVEGKYIPRQGDVVIGTVIDYNVLTWTVDINSIFYGYLLARDVVGRRSLERLAAEGSLKVGDVVMAKILSFNVNRDPLLTLRGPGLGRITEGELVRISPLIVYRLLDRRDKLYKEIEEKTKCKLTIGMNGVIVVKGSPEDTLSAVKALKLIDTESRFETLSRSVRSALSTGTGE